MSKQPYIPLYIGDWEKDTNTISLEAEGALLKLIFKLWNAKDRGQLSISLNQLSILLKKSRDLTEKILKELKENEVLNIEFLPQENLKIVSRRMLKDIEKSKSASDRGKKGGRPKKANQKLNKSQPKANPDNDIDIKSEAEIKNYKGGSGEILELCFPFDDENFMTIWEAWVKYRIEIRKPYQTFSSIQAELQELGKYGQEKAIYLITKAIKNGWKNITDDGTYEKQIRKQGTDYHGNKAGVADLNATTGEILRQFGSNFSQGSDT